MQKSVQGGVLARLRRDNKGNVLAMSAAAMFPLLGMIGGGVDISRIYLAQVRLQQACDAGALAGRRSMTGITWTTDNRTVANQFFNMNFPDGKYGTKNKSISYTASNTGAVTGSASVTVPMTLMSLFKMAEKTITTECIADLQLPNTDVMFVLDTTLSMNDTNPGDTQSRIQVLREAVQGFYTQLEQVKSPGSHIRYGFVPYSSTVNVGMLLRRDWMVTDWTYDSRTPDGTSVKEGTTAGDTVTDSGSYLLSGSYDRTTFPGSSERCQAPANEGYSDTYNPNNWTAWDPSSTALPRSRYRDRVRVGTTYSAALSSGVCTITKTVFNSYTERYWQTIKANPNAGQTSADSSYYHWIYQPVSYSLANLRGSNANGLMAGGQFTAQVENNHANRTIKWNAANACIEERDTRRTNESTSVPRYDMEVDSVPDPTKPATQWRPYLPGLVFIRKATSFTATSGWVFSGSTPTKTRDVNLNATTNYPTPNSSPYEYGACPSAAKKLEEITTASTLTNYLAGLKPAGYTYHDIGFLWGLRLMSREGLFSAENQAAESTGKVARHLIFMTDGDTDTRIGSYDAWGVSAMARRRTDTASLPTNTAQNTVTEDRLRELCTIAKDQKSITVWVIAFGTNKTPLLTSCASPGRDYQADDAAQLTATFSQIASQIAQLRITK